MSEVLVNTIEAPSAVSAAQVEEQKVDRTVFDAIRDTKAGRFIAGSVGALMCTAAVGGPLANSAEGSTVPSTTTTHQEGGTHFTETENTRVLIGASSMSAESVAKAKVMGNHRTFAKAKVREVKRDGGCDTFTSSQAIKRGFMTQGYNGSGINYAYENRRSTMCDMDGDGDYDVRAECGNAVKDRAPKPEKAKVVVWVKNFKKAALRMRSKVSVLARTDCSLAVEGGSVSAAASGRAEASGTIRMKLRNAMKFKGRGVQKVKTREVANMKASLRTLARADAVAICVASGGKPTVTPPPEQPKPKDGTPGPGEGTPGQPGGPGAGGEPGNEEEGVICRDTNDTQNGDRNPSTEGDLMYGQEVDQFGYCVGPAVTLE